MNINEILGSGFSKTDDLSRSSTQELGQEDFLKLLVAQLKNQDPTNPADNSEFLSQIAQFSMVSGIDDLGTSFNSIAGNLYATQAMQAANLVGREVLTESSSTLLNAGDFSIDGVIGFENDSNAVQMKIRDASGALVDVIDIGVAGAGEQSFSWGAIDPAGNTLPAGEYSFSVEGIVNGELQSMPVQLYNRVNSISVDRSSQQVRLHLDNRESVELSHISEFK